MIGPSEGAIDKRQLRGITVRRMVTPTDPVLDKKVEFRVTEDTKEEWTKIWKQLGVGSQSDFLRAACKIGVQALATMKREGMLKE